VSLKQGSAAAIPQKPELLLLLLKNTRRVAITQPALLLLSCCYSLHECVKRGGGEHGGRVHGASPHRMKEDLHVRMCVCVRVCVCVCVSASASAKGAVVNTVAGYTVLPHTG